MRNLVVSYQAETRILIPIGFLTISFKAETECTLYCLFSCWTYLPLDDPNKEFSSLVLSRNLFNSSIDFSIFFQAEAVCTSKKNQ